MPSANIPIPPDGWTDAEGRARGRRLFYGEKIRHVSPLPPVHAVAVVRVKQRRGGADGDLLSISLVQIIHLPDSSPTAEDLPFSDRTGGGGEEGWDGGTGVSSSPGLPRVQFFAVGTLIPVGTCEPGN